MRIGTSPLLLTYLLDRQVRRLRNDIEHRVRRATRQRQAMQSFPSADSDRGSIEFTRLFDSFSLRALRFLDLLANNVRRIGTISRRWQVLAETPKARRHTIYLKLEYVVASCWQAMPAANEHRGDFAGS